MIQFQKVADRANVSQQIGSSTNPTYWFRVIKSDALETSNLPGPNLSGSGCNFAQGPCVFAPLGWKSVEHLKFEGTVLDALSDNGFQIHSPNEIVSGKFYSGGFSKAGVWYVPMGGCLITWESSETSARMLYVLPYVTKGGAAVASWGRVRFSLSHYWKAGVHKYKFGGTATYGLFNGASDVDEYIRAIITETSDDDANARLERIIEVMASAGVNDSPSNFLLSFDAVADFTNVERRFYDERRLVEVLRHDASYVMRQAIHCLNDNRASLHAKAFDTLQKFDGNFLVLSTKLAGAGTIGLQSIAQLATSSKGIKDYASYWLAARYGDRLSVSGMASLVKSVLGPIDATRVKTEPFTIGNSRLSVPMADGSTCFLGCTLAVKPKDYNRAMAMIRHAMEWDAWPTLSNTWDAIPLSFVIDWFVNVGDIYASLDRMVQSRYYDVQCVLESVKSVTACPLVPDAIVSYYRRDRNSAGLHLGVSSVELGLPTAVNVVDAASLVCGFL